MDATRPYSYRCEAIEQLLVADKPIDWLFLGDSITHGCIHTAGSRNYVEHFTERIRGEMERTTDYVINTATSGHTTADLLVDLDRRVTRFKPDVVFLMVGMNDAVRGDDGLLQYVNNLEKLADRITGTGAQLILQSPNSVISELAPGRESLEKYMSALKKFAEQRGLPFIDHYGYWTSRNDVVAWLSDPFHPNQWGHTEMAQTIFKAIGIYDPASRTCGLATFNVR